MQERETDRQRDRQRERDKQTGRRDIVGLKVHIGLSSWNKSHEHHKD